MPIQYRQGDVLLVRTRVRRWERLRRVEPAGGRIVLALGALTGHAHVVDPPRGAPGEDPVAGSPRVALYEDPLANRYLEVRGAALLRQQEHPALLRHEEHDPIPLPPGVYRVVLQREYVPGTIRRVLD